MTSESSGVARQCLNFTALSLEWKIKLLELKKTLKQQVKRSVALNRWCSGPDIGLLHFVVTYVFWRFVTLYPLKFGWSKGSNTH